MDSSKRLALPSKNVPQMAVELLYVYLSEEWYIINDQHPNMLPFLSFFLACVLLYAIEECNVMDCLASKEGGCGSCGCCEQKCVVIPGNANFLAELIIKALCYCDACAFPSASKSYQKHYQLCLTFSCIQPLGELLFAVVVGINESSAFNRAKQIKTDNYLV